MAEIHQMKEVRRKEFYLFSPFLRIFHWIMVAMILVLFGTGIIIATPLQSMNLEPAYSTTYIDLVRDIHFVAAFVFCASFVLRIYGFIINRGDRLTTSRSSGTRSRACRTSCSTASSPSRFARASRCTT